MAGGETAAEKVYIEPRIVKDGDRCVALGEEGPEAEVAEVGPPPANDHERMEAFEQRLNQIALSLDSLYKILNRLREVIEGKKDSDVKEKIEQVKSQNKIPEGTVLNGVTRGVPYYLEVKEGGFFVGTTKYETLSAAAEGVSKVRRSGWKFWRLPDGRTVKEVFKG
jgi:hypothetical protein